MASSLRSIAPLKPYNPSSSSSSFAHSFPSPTVYGPPTPRASSKRYTLQQALRLAYLQKQKHPHHSLLGKVVHAAGHGLETALDYVARPSYGIAEGTRRALDHGSFEKGFVSGFTGKKKTGFGSILAEHSAFFRHHKVLRAISGIGLDIATDPTNLLLIAAAPETGGASLGALAEKVGSREAASGLLKTSRALREGKMTKTEAEGAAKLFDKAGPEWTAHRELAQHTYERLAAAEHKVSGEPFSLPGLHKFSFKQADAAQEFRKIIGANRRLAVHAIVPFGPKWAGRRTISATIPFTRTPSLMRLAEGKGALGAIASLTRTKGAFEHLGKAFKPGWRNEKYHALEMTANRVQEQLGDAHLKNLHDTVAPAAKKLSEAEQIDALDKAVATKGLVTTPARVLNELKLDKMVRQGIITRDQADFIRAWHNHFEYLRHADIDYAVPYESMKGVENKIYVPHIYTTQGLSSTAAFGKSALAKQGFQFERATGPNMDDRLQAMKALFDQGVHRKEIETDPMKLAHIRTQRGAMSEANSLMQHAIAEAEGIPTRIANVEKLKSLSKERQVVLKKQKDLRSHPEWMSEAGAHAEAYRAELLVKENARHAEAVAARKRAYNKFQKRGVRARKARVGVATIPTHSSLVKMGPKELGAFKKGLPAKEAKGFDAFRSHFSIVQKYERRLRKLRGVEAPFGGKLHGSNFKDALRDFLNEIGETDQSILTKRMGKIATADGGTRAETWEDRFANRVKAERERSVRVWNAFRAKNGIKRNGVPFAAHMGAQKKALQTELVRHQTNLQEIEQKTAKELNKRQFYAEQKAAVQERRGVQYQQKLDKIERQLVYHETSVKNPALVGRTDLEEVSRLKHPTTGVPLAVPHELAQALTRVKRISTDDETLLRFEQSWGKYIGRWKVWATVMNPGYRVRNTLSDIWNAYVSGMPMWAIPAYGGKGMKLLVDVKRGDPKAMQTFLEAYDHGILSGLFQGDVQKVAEMLKGRRSYKGLLTHGKGLQATQKLATDFNRNAENLGRLAHYLYRRDFEHMGVAEAAHTVRAAHFDYEDLTPFERKLKASVIPFYTWTRKNIPYQITQLASRPGRYSAVSKMMNEFNQAAGTGQGPTPNWMKGQLAFHVPFGGKGNMMLTQFGPIDIEKLEHPMQMAGMLSPLIKAPIELATNKSFLTGAPIRGKDAVHPRNPIAGGLVADVLGNLPGSNVGLTSRSVRGKTVYGEGANPTYTYLASQVPLANQFVTGRSSIKQKQRGGKVGGMGAATLSELFGLSTYQPDPEAELTARRTNLELGFKQYLKGLRDERKVKQPKRKKKNRYDTRLNQLLGG